jgi:allantoinase
MPIPSFSIHSKNMLLPGGVGDATVFIQDGVIRGVEEGLVGEPGFELLDMGDKVVMPGVIDPHVHINEPGRTDWEGFDTATRSALSGGLTTLVDMPLNADPVTTTVAAFDKKLMAAAGQLHCNCGFWGGVVPGNEKEIEPLIGRGVLGFKAFLTHSGIDEFPNVTEGQLRKVMPVIARYGLPLLVHCELEGGSGGARVGVPGRTGEKENVEDAGRTDERVDPRSYRNYLLSRPSKWEEDAIGLMIRLCAEYQCRTHIVHLSSAGSIDLIRKAKDRGAPLTVETAQHYLYFAAEGIKDGETTFKCAPPIRGKENNDKLWEALQEGLIDFVATDHSPAPPVMKELESGNFIRAWGGIASVQFALSALWTVTRKRGGVPGDLVKWLNEAPAILIGESGRRGKITPGYIADLVVWDPEAAFFVTKDRIEHKHKITPYLGEQLYGVVEQTWLGGVKVFDKGVFTGINQGRIILNKPERQEE